MIFVHVNTQYSNIPMAMYYYIYEQWILRLATIKTMVQEKLEHEAIKPS